MVVVNKSRFFGREPKIFSTGVLSAISPCERLRENPHQASNAATLRPLAVLQQLGKTQATRAAITITEFVIGTEAVTIGTTRPSSEALGAANSHA